MATKPAAEPTTAIPAEVPTAPAEPVTPEPVTAQPPETVKDAAWWESKAKAMEAEKVATAKKLAKLEAADQARQDAEKTELEKANARAEAAEKKAKSAELAILRRDAAVKIGLPAALVDRLQGETPEEIEADAKLLLDAMPKAAPEKPIPPKVSPTLPGSPQTGETYAERKARLGV